MHTHTKTNKTSRPRSQHLFRRRCGGGEDAERPIEGEVGSIRRPRLVLVSNWTDHSCFFDASVRIAKIKPKRVCWFSCVKCVGSSFIIIIIIIVHHLCSWVAHGYGEFRHHPAEDAFEEGQYVSGVLQGRGTQRFFAAERTLTGVFANDRATGLAKVSTENSDPLTRAEHPVSHRLAVYQRGKQICFLDDLRAGQRIKVGPWPRDSVVVGQWTGGWVDGWELRGLVGALDAGTGNRRCVGHLFLPLRLVK